jgi:hypothetical protein
MTSRNPLDIGGDGRPEALRPKSVRFREAGWTAYKIHPRCVPKLAYGYTERIRQQATDMLRGDVALKGGNSLNNVANLIDWELVERNEVAVLR